MNRLWITSLGGHHQEHRLIHGHVQVGIDVAAGILEQPLPLPGGDADLPRPLRRIAQVHVAGEPAVEQDDDNGHGNARPHDLQQRVVAGRLGRCRSRPAAVTDHEHRHQHHDEEEKERGSHQQELEQVMHHRRLRGLRRRQPERSISLASRQPENRIPSVRQTARRHQGAPVGWTGLFLRTSRRQNTSITAPRTTTVSPPAICIKWKAAGP